MPHKRKYILLFPLKFLKITFEILRVSHHWYTITFEILRVCHHLCTITFEILRVSHHWCTLTFEILRVSHHWCTITFEILRVSHHWCTSGGGGALECNLMGRCPFLRVSTTRSGKKLHFYILFWN